MTAAVTAVRSPLPVPVVVSGSGLAGAPMGVLPIGATLAGPHINKARTSGN